MSVLVVLALIWAAVLIPPVLRARAERRAEFIDSFQEQMGALRTSRRDQQAASKAAAPRRVVSPVKRRRDVLGGLVGAMLGALFLGAVPSLRPVWFLFLFLFNLFVGYVSLLAHQRNLALRRQMGPAPARRRAPAPARVRKPARPLAPALDTTS